MMNINLMNLKKIILLVLVGLVAVSVLVTFIFYVAFYSKDKEELTTEKKAVQDEVKDYKFQTKSVSDRIEITEEKPLTTERFVMEYLPKASTFDVVITQAASIEEWRNIKKESEKIFTDKGIDLCSIFIYWTVPSNIKPQLAPGDLDPTNCPR